MINFSCLVFLANSCGVGAWDFSVVAFFCRSVAGSWRELIMLLFLLKGSKMKDEAIESVSAGLSYSIEIKDAYIPPWIISSIWATMGSEGRSFEARHDKFCHCAWLFSMISPDLTTKSCSNGRRINICNWELWLSVIHLTGNHVIRYYFTHLFMFVGILYGHI